MSSQASLNFFFAGDTSESACLLLLLAFGASLPMILGIFLICPIPLPVQEDSDLDVDTDSFVSESDPYSRHSPVLDYNFAEALYSNTRHRTALNDCTK